MENLKLKKEMKKQQSNYVKPTLVSTPFEIECDWGTERFSLYHDDERGEYCLATDNWNLVIRGCPANSEKIDTNIVSIAVECWLDCYNIFEVMSLRYDGIEEQVENIMCICKFDQLTIPRSTKNPKMLEIKNDGKNGLRYVIYN
jgi:hypothetical protein